MRKIILTLLSTALTIGMLSGCGSESGHTNEGGTVSTAKLTPEVEAMSAGEYTCYVKVQYGADPKIANCTQRYIFSLKDHPEERAIYIDKVKKELDDGPAITTERKLFQWDTEENGVQYGFEKTMPVRCVCKLMKFAAEKQGYTEIDFDTISAVDFELWYFDKFYDNQLGSSTGQVIRNNLTYLVEKNDNDAQTQARKAWINEEWTPEEYPDTIVTFDLNKNYLFDKKTYELVERVETEEEKTE